MDPQIGEKIVVKNDGCEQNHLGFYIGYSERYGHEIIGLSGAHFSFTHWREHLGNPWIKAK